MGNAEITTITKTLDRKSLINNIDNSKMLQKMTGNLINNIKGKIKEVDVPLIIWELSSSWGRRKYLK